MRDSTRHIVSTTLERWLLPILATMLVVIVMTNPLKWDWQYQLGAAFVIVGLAVCVGHTIEKMRMPTAPIAATPASALSMMSAQDLKTKAVTLVGQIRSLRESYSNAAGKTEAEYQDAMAHAKNKGRSDVAWRAYNSAKLESMMREQAEYERSFKAEALVLANELKRRMPEYKSSYQNVDYNHPTNSLGIGLIADDLETMAKQLP
jgi:hypothetical protein